MWEWTLNWDLVRDDVIVGSCPINTSDIDKIIQSTEVSAILSLQSEQCRAHFDIDFQTLCDHARINGIFVKNTPMLDFNDDDQRRVLPSAVRALYELLAKGHRVYVHCTAGLNRSPLTVLGYLTFIEQESAEAALSSIRLSRPDADPSLAAYHGCRTDLVEALRDHISVRAYYLSEEHPDPESNWHVAERDVLRGAFVNAKTFPCPRLDPSRG
jgi:predicted protein tyrosine phosphatase